MKKIIDGLLYDTNKSDYICESGNNRRVEDFNYERSSLYRSENGSFFLYGQGGALSRFGISTGDGARTGRSDDTIIPVSKYEARKLVETHGEYDDYVTYFGEPKSA